MFINRGSLVDYANNLFYCIGRNLVTMATHWDKWSFELNLIERLLSRFVCLLFFYPVTLNVFSVEEGIWLSYLAYLVPLPDTFIYYHIYLPGDIDLWHFDPQITYCTILNCFEVKGTYIRMPGNFTQLMFSGEHTSKIIKGDIIIIHVPSSLKFS